MTKNINVIIGSLRRGSYARKIAHNAIDYFPEGYKASILEIRDLPLYDFDYDDPEVADVRVPEEYTAFREAIKASDGILFVTPENNRTIPACLKNAIDIGSNPMEMSHGRTYQPASLATRWAAWAATAHRRTFASPCHTSTCRRRANQRCFSRNHPPFSMKRIGSMKALRSSSKTT